MIKDLLSDLRDLRFECDTYGDVLIFFFVCFLFILLSPVILVQSVLFWFLGLISDWLNHPLPKSRKGSDEE